MNPDDKKDRILKIPTDFCDKVNMLYYCPENNLVFAGSREGKFKCWKFPNDWNNSTVGD